MDHLKKLHHRLAEAETALHRLMTGELEVTVSVGGYGATTYTQVSSDKLIQYINRLQHQIAVAEKRPRRAPLRIRF